MARPWKQFHKWKASRVKRVTANAWNLEQQLARDERERELIKKEVAARQVPEVDQWEQDHYGKGETPKPEGFDKA